MKRPIFLILSLVIGFGICKAQNISELFKGNDFLTSVFVNPLGIKDLPDDTDPMSVENKIKQSGCEFRSIDMGVFGTMFSITPGPSNHMTIGDVPVIGIGACINNDAVMIIYRMESTDDYMTLPEKLGRELKPYVKSAERSGSESNLLTVYMLTDTYGIGVGTNEKQKTAMVSLIDIRNLLGFISLGSLIGQ